MSHAAASNVEVVAKGAEVGLDGSSLRGALAPVPPPRASRPSLVAGGTTGAEVRLQVQGKSNARSLAK